MNRAYGAHLTMVGQEQLIDSAQVALKNDINGLVDDQTEYVTCSKDLISEHYENE